jgi:hypothetical protein
MLAMDRGLFVATEGGLFVALSWSCRRSEGVRCKAVRKREGAGVSEGKYECSMSVGTGVSDYQRRWPSRP